ncbi:MAG TPA: selenocysteine-specific translation elongation factor [Terriglobales bacterium]|nr:selenocysteine-specific translation elongation factor [Terriglobales bacterium]
MPEKAHVIIGTAGHIDHGKSALVKALTGTDPDTLPEEKARGMTIELGFVFLDDPAYEKQIVFIDVPGHERFIKTMAAGASHVDAALLVIATDEGISVQTREHFDILRLLGVGLGAVVLTKSDLVDGARLAEVAAAVRAHARGSFLDGAPIAAASSVTGAGLEEVRAVLRDLGRRAAPRPDNGIFRMPIDRVFTVQGFGTVVAGTVLGGRVRTGDEVEVFPDGLRSRVRGVQVHGERTEASGLGRRTALNLQDLKKEHVRRGQVAGAPGSLTPTVRLDARLDVLPGIGKDVKHRDRVRLHIGTDEVMARLALLEGQTVGAGGSALAQLILERPAVALPGDRFVIRSFSPLVTIGGGQVLDASPEKHKRFSGEVAEGMKRLGGAAREAVEQSFLQAAGLPLGLKDAALKLGRSEAEVAEAARELVAAGRLVAVSREGAGAYLHVSAYEGLKREAEAAVREYFEGNPERPLMPYADLRAGFLKRGDAATLKLIVDELCAAGILTREKAQLGLIGHEARLRPADRLMADRIEAVFRAARYAAPLEEDVRRTLGLNPSALNKLMDALVREGRIVRLAPKVIYHRDAVEAAREAVLGLIARRGSVTIAELRDRLNVSRKYAQAVLEYFDKTGLTRRVEDRHVLAQRTERQDRADPE